MPKAKRSKSAGRQSLLQAELKQTKPFRSLSQEASLGIMRTADALRRYFNGIFMAHGITHSQYNVLRILRGAGEPLPTLTIGDRLVEHTPGITRMLDRLEAKGWVERQRCASDRRQVLCSLTPKGSALLAELDGVVDAADDRCLGKLKPGEQLRLVELLETVRRVLPAS